MQVMEYAVIIESGPRNMSAYLPDLPGCVATGDTEEEVIKNIRDAARFHIEGMRKAGERVPRPTCKGVQVKL
jgi:predicted RNase H-like HicB family nuclease